MVVFQRERSHQSVPLGKVVSKTGFRLRSNTVKLVTLIDQHIVIDQTTKRKWWLVSVIKVTCKNMTGAPWWWPTTRNFPTGIMKKNSHYAQLLSVVICIPGQ